MNNSSVNKQVYAQKVELLLRLMPVVMEECAFAVHGGTAINLFLKDLPRYSVDIDLTYIPLADRTASIDDINSHFLSDSRKNPSSNWINRLQIIDSTTVTLFSNMPFKGVGRHPKTGKKKGGIKVHTNIHANEGVPSDVRLTSAATNDSFMLKPTNYAEGDILALDRAYIDYGKFEELTTRGVI